MGYTRHRTKHRQALGTPLNPFERRIMPSPSLNAVLWDMDGVLIDSGPLHRRAWQLFLKRKGLDIGETIFTLGFGRPNTEVIPEFLGDRLGDALTPERIAQLSDEKERCYRDLVRAQGVTPVPGVLDWLKRFSDAGIRQAVATSGCRANAELIVERLGAAPYLQAIVTAEDAPRGKPHPDLFLLAAERLSTLPSQCLVIEDSLHGIRAAQAAGMRCLALTTTHRATQLKASAILTDMAAFSWKLWQRLDTLQAP